MSTTEKETGLKRLREPFEENQIGKLPKPTRQQTDAVKNDYKNGARCNVCGGWHHPKVVHLDYVGHAALTDRFLDADEKWSWKPLALTEQGLPMLDKDGLLWIELTIAGVTRLGVGDAGTKSGGDAMKERIGDALRNAGMRFGAALDLWHKGDLHVDSIEQEPKLDPKAVNHQKISQEQVIELERLLDDVNADMKVFLTFFSGKAGFEIKALSELPSDAFGAAKTMLKNKKQVAA